MFENFLVDPKTLLVTGSGWHSYATNRCTYQVSGKYQVETKEILFTEVYTNNNKE
jgi:O-glycosyl hydrolase